MHFYDSLLSQEQLKKLENHFNKTILMKLHHLRSKNRYRNLFFSNESLERNYGRFYINPLILDHFSSVIIYYGYNIL